MVRARFALLAVAVLLIGATAGTARSDTSAPTGLHAFLLRADEPAKTAFSRTPSFSWNPAPGADHYEFQLSLSDQFRDNSVVYADLHVPSPVLAPNLTLPWITGNPHSLYARVRGILADGSTTPWSASFGFDMVAPAPPTPLASYPGLLRWTPIEGAAAYQVWFVDTGKMETVTTNVLDEREFYTFHQAQSWMGSVRWRIRVVRPQSGQLSRLNSIPAANYGPWSTTYVSTNPAYAGGPLKLVGTVSDVFSDGSDGSPAHKLMPAFLWTGNTGLSGSPTELARVEIFTDRQCLNRVFTGAVTGAPAYSPRPFGPLALPSSSDGIAAARNQFLPDGGEPTGVTIDGDTLTTTEMAASATPTGTAPGVPGDGGTGGTGSGASSSGGSTSSSGSSSSPAPAPAPSPGSSTANGGASGTITWSGQAGAPVDLWDVNWPHAGYYWTVIPVSVTPPNALQTSVAAPGAKTDDTVLPVANTNGFATGDSVQIGSGASAETRTVAGVGAGSLTLASKLTFAHGAGETVVRVSGTLQYHDTELAQDACASGRVARFGKESEPSLTASGDLFATGLSSDGRLTSAVHTTAFYGPPLVSWTPALGAMAYEVQWSKVAYPFNPEPSPSGNTGFMTTGTSMVLPVGPGVWYYRVRGFDYSLPSGSQQMSWSDPAKIVVAKPQFKVVGIGSAPKPAAKPKAKPASAYKTVKGTGFSMQVPSSWVSQSSGGFGYGDGKVNVVATISASERAGRSYADWASALAAQLKSSGSGAVSTGVVQLGPGKAIRVTTTFNKKSVLEYVLDQGNIEYVIAFSGAPADYLKNLPAFGHAISSFKLG